MITLIKTTLFTWVFNNVLNAIKTKLSSTGKETIDDKAENLRLFLIENTQWIAKITKATTFTLDDKAAAFVQRVLNDPALFALIYNALTGIEPVDNEVTASSSIIRRLKWKHCLTETDVDKKVIEARPILNAIRNLVNGGNAQ